MTATVAAPTTRATVGDRVRAGALLLVALLQIVAGGLGGSGAFGLSVGVVARENTTVVMPVPAAFSIWGVIYAGILLLAVRQVLPGQPARPVHRATGWWLVASGVFNTGWILAFSAQAVVLAQVIIVALLVVLAVAMARLTAHPAADAADRLMLHGPVGLYAGWVSVATVVGAATTGTFLGAPGDGRRRDGPRRADPAGHRRDRRGRRGPGRGRAALRGLGGLGARGDRGHGPAPGRGGRGPRGAGGRRRGPGPPGPHGPARPPRPRRLRLSHPAGPTGCASVGATLALNVSRSPSIMRAPCRERDLTAPTDHLRPRARRRRRTGRSLRQGTARVMR